MPEKVLVLQQRGDGQGDMAVIGAWFGKLRSLQRQASRDEHEKSRSAGNDRRPTDRDNKVIPGTSKMGEDRNLFIVSRMQRINKVKRRRERSEVAMRGCGQQRRPPIYGRFRALTALRADQIYCFPGTVSCSELRLSQIPFYALLHAKCQIFTLSRFVRVCRLSRR